MIDKLMKKRGYEKTSEDKYGVYYERKEPQGYTHVACVIAKSSGRHLMQSYDKKVVHVPGRTWGLNDAGFEVRRNG